MPKVSELLKALSDRGLHFDVEGGKEDLNERITHVAKVDSGTRGALSYITSEYCRFLQPQRIASDSSLIIAERGPADPVDTSRDSTLIRVDRPRLVYAILANLLPSRAGFEYLDAAHPQKGFHLDKRAQIGPGTSIGLGTIIGSSSQSYERDLSGELIPLPQLGGVMIGDHVSIGGYCVIDRATFDLTVIGSGTRIESSVHVGHNAKIGQSVAVASGARISGGVSIGNECWIGPNSVISDNISIGANAHIGIGSVVVRDVPSGARILGNPARSLPRDR